MAIWFLSGRRRTPAHHGRRIPWPAIPTLIALSAFLAQPVPSWAQTGVEATNEPAASETGDDLRELLTRIEQQMSRGHTFGPADDNALATWRLVIKKASTGSPETVVVLRNFVARARNRKLIEAATGRPSVAESFSMFADLGADLLSRFDNFPETPSGPDLAASSVSGAADDHVAQEQPASGSRGAEAAHGAVEVAPAGSATPWERSPPTRLADGAGQIQVQVDQNAGPQPAATAARPVAVAPLADTVASTSAASPPVPATPALPAPSPAPSPASVSADARVSAFASAERPARLDPPAAPVGQAPPAVIIAREPYDGATEQELKRGDDMMVAKDISAARKFYTFAANAGSARAAAALARTYDPAFLTRFGVVGLRADPAKALLWYNKAAELGDADATARLRTLGAEASR